MTKAPRTVLPVWLAVACTTVGASDAAADVSKRQCVDANTLAQSLRRQGKFEAARESLGVCGDASCPSLVRDDCATRLDELNAAQPTLVLDVTDIDGNGVTDVAVTVDGNAVQEPFGPTALVLDPGEHLFAFTKAGQPPVVTTLILREGEKERHERILMPTIAPAVRTPTAPAQASPTEGAVQRSTDEPTSSSGIGPRKAFAVVTGVLGIGAVASGAALGFAASSAFSAQKRDCGSPSVCLRYSQALSDHATAESDGIGSTVGFVIGGALLASATILFFGGKGSSLAPTTARLVVGPAFGPANAGIAAHGEF